MVIEKRFSALAVFVVFLALTIASASAGEFEAEKYIRTPSAAAALAIAVQYLENCEEDLSFSEKEKAEGEEKYLVVTISCPKMEAEPGKFVKEEISVTFEQDEDGIGRVLDYDYN